MYLLGTKNLNTNHKNHRLFFALGGWLQEKNRTKKIGK